MRKSKKGLWHGLFSLFATLFAILIGLTMVAFQYLTAVNGFLGLQSTKMVSDANDEVDTIYYKSDFKTADELIAYRDGINKRVGAEGSVLLKNTNNALPLKATTATPKKVTMFGMASFDPAYGGASGGAAVSYIAGQTVNFTEAFAKQNIQVNPTMMNFYSGLSSQYKRIIPSPGFGTEVVTADPKIGEVPKKEYDAKRADLNASYATYGDAAICVISRAAGEAYDVPFTTEILEDHDGERALQLTSAEKNMIEEAKLCSDTVIVLVNTANAIEIKELKDDADVDAIVWMGMPGAKGLEGLAEVMNGLYDFSGHLPQIYAANSMSSPAAKNLGHYEFTNADVIADNQYGDTYLVYAENIYVGYLYYETRYEDCVLDRFEADSTAGSSTGNAWNYTDEVAYTFGYGQSYSEYEQSFVGEPVFSGDEVTFKVKVTNNGDIAGMSAVQIYYQSPYTQYDIENGIEKAAVQLLTFDKTELIQPKDSVTCEITVDAKYLASYDENVKKTYILEADENYYFALGNGAHDALNNILAKKGKTVADGMDYDGNADLAVKWNNETENNSFATAKNGVKITNQFDDADLNYYNTNVTVKYLTRSDWEDSFPISYTGVTASETMLPTLGSDTYVPGSDDISAIKNGELGELTLLALRGAEFDDPRWEKLLDQLTIEEMVIITKFAGPCIPSIKSAGFIGAPGSIAAWDPSAGTPPPGGADGQSGMSPFFGGPPFRIIDANSRNPYGVTADSPYAKVGSYTLKSLHAQAMLAATFSPELAKEQGKLFGNDSLWSNDLYSSWSVGLNIHRTPYGGRNFEYLSEDAMLSNIMGAKMIRSARDYGHIMVPKHFVLNEQETNRSSVATFATEQAMREVYLRAFEGPMSPDDGGCLGVMGAFNRVGIEQASLNTALLKNVLKGEWGFEGFATTDMASDAIHVGRPAVVAGTDAMLNAFAKFEQLNVKNFSSDAKLLSSAREASKRIMFMAVNSNAINGMDETSRFVVLTNWWQVVLIVAIVVFGVAAVAMAVLYVLSLRKGDADAKERKEVN